MSFVFSACPHDVIQDPEKWTALCDYLASHDVGQPEFQKYLSFDEFADHFAEMTFVYAHPLHAVKLRRDYGFSPVAKYQDVYDEAVFFAANSVEAPRVEDMHEKTVACIKGSPSHAAALINNMLHHPSVRFEALHHTNYPDVLMTVATNTAPYGIILKSVWDEMTVLKDRVRPFYATDTKTLVHVFMVAQDGRDHLTRIQNLLLTLDQDEEGQDILDRLHCSRLEKFDMADLDAMEAKLAQCQW